MKRRVFKLVLKSLVCLTVIISLLLITGCIFKNEKYENIESFIEDSGDGYKTITVSTELYSFSFEYSTFYELRKPERRELDWDIPETYLALRAPEAKVDLVAPAGSDRVRTSTATFIPASISVYIFDPTENGEKASFNATHFSNFQMEREARWEHFKLIERSPVIVSGIDGEYAEWEVDWVNLFPKGSEPPLEYRWYAVFDYKGQIWWIYGISSGPEYRDRINADIHHLVETFKILD